MAQVYGCIECGMLFAGWEFCLAHIEHCRPQHYLEVDKKTLKELCMIGHRRCMVPSYQPAMMGGGQFEEDDDDDQDGFHDMDDEDNANGVSKSYSDGSAEATTLTQDFLNPVDGVNQVANLLAYPDDEADMEQRDDDEAGDMERREVYQVEEHMTMQLFETKGDHKFSFQHSKSSTTVPTGMHSSSGKPPLPSMNNKRADGSGEYLALDEPKGSMDFDTRQKMLHRIEKNLHRLIHEASPISAEKPKMVLLGILPKVYEIQFGTKIDYEELGFPDLKTLLDAIPSVVVVVDSPYLGIEHEYLRRTQLSSQDSPINGSSSDEETQSGKYDKYKHNKTGEDGPAQDLVPRSPTSSMEDSGEERSFSNEKTPLHANHNIRKKFSFNVAKAGSLSSDESLSLQPISEQQSPTNSSSAKNKGAKRETQDGEEDASIGNSTVSSCGSSKSVINALAEMLPNTNAFGNIIRVLSKNPNGITIGKLMVQAPEFKNFLSHCTDRRCEAQIKLAHTVLQQCQGISYRRAATGTILYTKSPRAETPKPSSIVTSNGSSSKGKQQSGSQQQKQTTPRSRPFSNITPLEIDDDVRQPQMVSTETIDEATAKLFAASEFVTPSSSPRKGGTADKETNLVTPSSTRSPPNADDIFRPRPTQLDTISTPLQNTPLGSRTVSPAQSRGSSGIPASPKRTNPPLTPRSDKRTPSPAPSRTQSPGSTLLSVGVKSAVSREQSIADSAERFLAEAQSLATPTAIILAEAQSLASPGNNKDEPPHFPIPSPTTRPRTLSEDAAKIVSDAKEEAAREEAASTKAGENSSQGRNDKRMYFFTDEMSPDPDERSLVSLGATSSVTHDVETTEQHSVTSDTDGAKSDSEKKISAKKSGAVKAVAASKKKPAPLVSPDVAIEKLAFDLFPSTSMHYKLLVALAEHPGGMTWHQIDSLIPCFAGFVENYAEERCTEPIDPLDVLQACVSIVRKQHGDKILFFIHAPPERSSGTATRSNGGDDVSASTTSDMTEASSTITGSSILQEPSIFSLAYAGSDIMATLMFLRRLKECLRGRPWPASWQQTYQWLRRFEEETALSDDSGKHHSVRRWVANLGEDNLVRSHVGTRRQALNILLNYLQRLKCVARSGPDISWDQKGIATTLALPIVPRQQSKLSHFLGKTPVSFIETKEQLERVKDIDPFCSDLEEDNVQRVVTVTCEGAPNQLYVVQIGTESITYIFDCVKLGAKAVCSVLSNLLKNEVIVKAFHDLYYSAVALSKIGCIVEPLKNLLDTQIAMEALTGVPSMSFNRMLRQLGIAPHPMTKALSGKRDTFRERPISKELLSYAADHVDLLLASTSTLQEILQNKGSPSTDKQELWKSIQSASEARATMAVEKDGRRSICFDSTNRYSLASVELVQIQRPADIYECPALTYSTDAAGLLSLLPGDLVRKDSANEFYEHVTSVVLDQGRPAMAWFNDHRRVNLGDEERVVTAADIEAVTHIMGGFKHKDNRVGLRDQLHCISAVRNRKQDLIGLTMRVGKHVTGVANMISDLLFACPDKSILFVGESGAGKTTALRDVARVLSEQTSVSIVDTHCEIGGFCDKPHPSVGMARRFMVDRRQEQSTVMMECFQSQRPRVMIVDELESQSDIDAAIHCHRRGVRLIAATIGSMQNIVHDANLTPFLMGTQKGGGDEPIFDIIVELRRGAPNEWRIITDTMEAVESILDGECYPTQLRVRDPEKGNVQLEFDLVCIN